MYYSLPMCCLPCDALVMAGNQWGLSLFYIKKYTTEGSAMGSVRPHISYVATQGGIVPFISSSCPLFFFFLLSPHLFLLLFFFLIPSSYAPSFFASLLSPVARPLKSKAEWTFLLIQSYWPKSLLPIQDPMLTKLCVCWGPSSKTMWCLHLTHILLHVQSHFWVLF